MVAKFVRARANSRSLGPGLGLAIGLIWPATAWAVPVPVSDAGQLQDAINNAAPGDEIILADGEYSFGNKLNCTTNGTAAEPILVRAENSGQATIRFGCSSGHFS